MNFVIMGGCNPDTVEGFKQANIFLYGNVCQFMTLPITWPVHARSCLRFPKARGLPGMMKSCFRLAPDMVSFTNRWMSGSYRL